MDSNLCNIRVNCAKRIVFRLGHLCTSQCVEEGRFANIGVSNDAAGCRKGKVPARCLLVDGLLKQLLFEGMAGGQH